MRKGENGLGIGLTYVDLKILVAIIVAKCVNHLQASTPSPGTQELRFWWDEGQKSRFEGEVMRSLQEVRIRSEVRARVDNETTKGKVEKVRE